MSSLVFAVCVAYLHSCKLLMIIDVFLEQFDVSSLTHIDYFQ